MTTSVNKPAFYDEEMAATIKTVMDYLSTPRGQLSVNKLSQRDPELHRAITVTQRQVPWHNLGLPGWTP